MMAELIIDVSKWQGKMDWQKAKAAGVSGAMVKVSQGVYEDAQWVNNKANCNLDYKGGYHFLDYFNYVKGNEVAFGQLQAQKFVAFLEGWHDNLPGALDIESNEAWGVINQSSSPRIMKIALAFVNQYYSLRGHYPFIYASTNTVSMKEWTITGYQYIFRNFTKCPLWVANYNNISTPPTGAWLTYTLWQYSSTGDGVKYGNGVDGSKFVDLNRSIKPLGEIAIKPAGEITDAEKLAKLWAAHPEIH